MLCPNPLETRAMEAELDGEQLSPSQIFILAGQSNMAGRGGVHHGHWDGVIPPECHSRRQILRFSAHSRWIQAREPLHADIDSKKACGVGPAMPFASSLLSGGSPATIGLVPCAIGGTSIKAWEKGGTLYQNMVGRAREALLCGGEVKAVLWYQGESDTSSDHDADSYGANMENFIRDVRADLGLPGLPFIQVAICSGEGKWMKKVRRAQLEMKVDGVVCVDAMGLELKEDHLHLSTPAQVKLGEMMASAYLENFA